MLHILICKYKFIEVVVVLGGLVVIVLAVGPKVRWLKPGLGRCIFKGDKSP
jgi:hypothetical protein